MTAHCFIAVVISFLLLPGTGAGAKKSTSQPPPTAASNCSDELISFSKCLPYTSSSPNNTTDSPSRRCCKDVASAFASGNGVCFCYLIRKPNFFGFPLDTSRVLSLTTVCPMKDQETEADSSLSSLCSRTQTLPPLRSITSPEHSQPRSSGPMNTPSPPGLNFTQDYSDSEATDYSDTTDPVDSDGLHRVPSFPPRTSVSTYSINSKSGRLLPLIMAVVDLIIPVLT